MSLASQSSRPEHPLSVKRFHLVGIKPRVQYEALVQGFQLSGDNAFKLRTQLSIEDCSPLCSPHLPLS
jgi:hypothetical protein